MKCTEYIPHIYYRRPPFLYKLSVGRAPNIPGMTPQPILVQQRVSVVSMVWCQEARDKVRDLCVMPY